jgi:hypothetical protein
MTSTVSPAIRANRGLIELGSDPPADRRVPEIVRRELRHVAVVQARPVGSRAEIPERVAVVERLALGGAHHQASERAAFDLKADLLDCSDGAERLRDGVDDESRPGARSAQPSGATKERRPGRRRLPGRRECR